MYSATFRKLRSSSNPTKKTPNGVMFGDSKGSVSVTFQNQTLVHINCVSNSDGHHLLPQILTFRSESPCNFNISVVRDAKGFATFDKNVNPHRPLQNILNDAAGTLSNSRRVESNSFH